MSDRHIFLGINFPMGEASTIWSRPRGGDSNRGGATCTEKFNFLLRRTVAHVLPSSPESVVMSMTSESGVEGGTLSATASLSPEIEGVLTFSVCVDSTSIGDEEHSPTSAEASTSLSPAARIEADGGGGGGEAGWVNPYSRRSVAASFYGGRSTHRHHRTRNWVTRTRHSRHYCLGQVSPNHLHSTVPIRVPRVLVDRRLRRARIPPRRRSPKGLRV